MKSKTMKFIQCLILAYRFQCVTPKSIKKSSESKVPHKINVELPNSISKIHELKHFIPKGFDGINKDYIEKTSIGSHTGVFKGASFDSTKNKKKNDKTIAGPKLYMKAENINAVLDKVDVAYNKLMNQVDEIHKQLQDEIEKEFGVLGLPKKNDNLSKLSVGQLQNTTTQKPDNKTEKEETILSTVKDEKVVSESTVTPVNTELVLGIKSEKPKVDANKDVAVKENTNVKKKYIKKSIKIEPIQNTKTILAQDRSYAASQNIEHQIKEFQNEKSQTKDKLDELKFDYSTDPVVLLAEKSSKVLFKENNADFESNFVGLAQNKSKMFSKNGLKLFTKNHSHNMNVLNSKASMSLKIQSFNNLIKDADKNSDLKCKTNVKEKTDDVNCQKSKKSKQVCNQPKKPKNSSKISKKKLSKIIKVKSFIQKGCDENNIATTVSTSITIDDKRRGIQLNTERHEYNKDGKPHIEIKSEMLESKKDNSIKSERTKIIKSCDNQKMESYKYNSLNNSGTLRAFKLGKKTLKTEKKQRLKNGRENYSLEKQVGCVREIKKTKNHNGKYVEKNMRDENACDNSEKQKMVKKLRDNMMLCEHKEEEIKEELEKEKNKEPKISSDQINAKKKLEKKTPQKIAQKEKETGVKENSKVKKDKEAKKIMKADKKKSKKKTKDKKTALKLWQKLTGGKENSQRQEDLVTPEPIKVKEELSVGENSPVEEEPSFVENTPVVENPQFGENLPVRENPPVKENLSVGENPPVVENPPVGENLPVAENPPVGENLSVGENPTVGDRVGV